MVSVLAAVAPAVPAGVAPASTLSFVAIVKDVVDILCDGGN